MQHGSRNRNLQTQGYPGRFFDKFECTRQCMKDEVRGSHTGLALACLFFVLVSNHYFSIVLFLWSSSTYNTHINKSGPDSHTKTFSELYKFRSKLEARLYQLLYNLLLKIFAIQTTNQSVVKICLRWLLVT